MTQRFLLTRPLASLKIVLGFVAKLACTRAGLCRELFFDEGLDEATLERYMSYFKVCVCARTSKRHIMLPTVLHHCHYAVQK